MIRFLCRCGRELQANENLFGQRGRCPRCGHVGIIGRTPERFAELLAALAEKDESPPKPGINECGESIRGPRRRARLSRLAETFRVMREWFGRRLSAGKG
jgi:hypothetical protein